MPAALVLIDIQMGFKAPICGARNNPDAETNAARLLTAWRAQSFPICHIRHVSVEPGSPLGPEAGGTEFMPEVAPLAGEPIFEKSVNSGFSPDFSLVPMECLCCVMGLEVRPPF